MSRKTDYLRVTAILLLLFLIVVGISVWLLDQVTQQRTFGFLMSAEFIAFAMLVYIFYEQNPGVSKKLLTTGFVALGILVILAALTLVGVSAPLKPNVSETLYAGQVSLIKYGFGNNATAIISPGPTLNFTVGEIVNMTVYNVGTMGHNWALTTSNATSAKVLFGAQIDSGSTPIPVNGSASVVFKVTKPGNYYYVCQVPGHVQLGMWGNVVIIP
ncbi:MAG TPA: cupredoxin domain-containing protein [Candidatus Limnocylindrales bacterium]|nr:cupredoxin domain-containing protein [Candidatus Limnocylindrales bacterium]